MEARHIFSIYIYFNPVKPGPHRYSGGLVFDYQPIHLLSAISDEDAYEQSIRLGIKFRTCKETYITGRTKEDAEVIIDRLKGLIGTVKDGTGPLLSAEDLYDKKKSQNQSGIKKKSEFNRRSFALANEWAGKNWIVRNHFTGQSFFVFNLEKWLRENRPDLDSSNLRKTHDGTRRHHFGWTVRKANFFGWE